MGSGALGSLLLAQAGAVLRGLLSASEPLPCQPQELSLEQEGAQGTKQGLPPEDHCQRGKGEGFLLEEDLVQVPVFWCPPLPVP